MKCIDCVYHYITPADKYPHCQFVPIADWDKAPCGNGIRLTIKRGLCSSFFVALGGATAGPGMALPTDNGRADYGRGGPGFQIFPFMAIFSTNSTICQSIRSFPKLALYGTQSYVKWGGPVQRSPILEPLICGGAVLEVHNRGLRKLDLVMQKFFIKKNIFLPYISISI